MTFGVVDGVNTNGVHSKRLEVGDVALAGLGICKRILVGGGSSRLIVDAADVEAFSVGPESCESC